MIFGGVRGLGKGGAVYFMEKTKRTLSIKFTNPLIVGGSAAWPLPRFVPLYVV